MVLSHMNIDVNWTSEEQSILENGLDLYSSESSLSCYVKIAYLLENKTVRDVALRHHWISKKETAKRRKVDHDGFERPRSIDNQESVDTMVGLNSVTPQLFASSHGSIDNLLQQNKMLLNSIGANLQTSRMSENYNLFSQIHANIKTLVNNLNFENVPELMKQYLPPLPEKLRSDLFDSMIQQPYQQP